MIYSAVLKTAYYFGYLCRCELKKGLCQLLGLGAFFPRTYIYVYLKKKYGPSCIYQTTKTKNKLDKINDLNKEDDIWSYLLEL